MRRLVPTRRLLAIAVLVATPIACSKERSPTPSVEAIPASNPSPAARASNTPSAKKPGGEPMTDDASSIGSATMESDGTIVLQLRAEGPGVRGDAQLRYPRDHKQYDSVLEHLGGLRPGESKPVPPWPDEP